MSSSKPLFVTMSFDLGSSSQSKALEKLLDSEFDFFNLDLKKIKAQQSTYLKIRLFLQDLVALRKQVKVASKRNSKIIFFNLKPALFTIDLWDKTNALTCSDFSHSLFNWYNQRKIKRDLRFYFQKKLYSRFYRILTWTENLKQCISEVYDVDITKVLKVPLPLDFDELAQQPTVLNKIPKVLFVGGELERKGGNLLVNAWETKLKGKCELIILTQSKFNAPEGLKVFNNILKGSKQHIELFKTSDIFILPTYRDAFPYVLGEAAMASMAIVTTQYALGAKDIIKHGKSGYIAENSEKCVDYLMKLLENHELIKEFKNETYKLVQQGYSKKIVVQSYLNAIK